MNPVIIGIAGGSGAGKTTIADRIIDVIGSDFVAGIRYDAYYADLGHLSLDERQQCNFDHPDAFDTTLCIEHLDRLSAGHAIQVPNYDFAQYTRIAGGAIVTPKPIILIDGILLFVNEALRQRMHLRVYIDTADDIRILRRTLRDIQERGRDVASVYQQYLSTVRPMHQRYVAPSRQYADVIIPGEHDVSPAIELLCNHIRQILVHHHS